jgi:uncharacterized membrane protein YhaH (DUF805 family)
MKMRRLADASVVSIAAIICGALTGLGAVLLAALLSYSILTSGSLLAIFIICIAVLSALMLTLMLTVRKLGRHARLPRFALLAFLASALLAAALLLFLT